MNYAAIIARQREFFHSGATRSQDFRRVQLQKLAGLLETREAELLAALHADLRKSPHEAYVSEIGLVLGEIRHALRHLPSWMKPERRRSPVLAWPARSRIHPEPYGVALIIGPWNDPLQLLLSPLVGAIAAGNCAILKPSEIFGPVLPVMEFSDLGEVLTKLRDRPKPLAVYLFTRDAALQERVISNTQSGGICINDTILHILGNDLPFGGVGESGMGNSHGRASFDCFSHQHAVLCRPLTVDPGFRYPPPGVSLKWLKRLLRFLG
jgi:acyl-CoA reductase-like NAD-dependent aldehyde dehydrogenase